MCCIINTCCTSRSELVLVLSQARESLQGSPIHPRHNQANNTTRRYFFMTVTKRNTLGTKSEQNHDAHTITLSDSPDSVRTMNTWHTTTRSVRLLWHNLLGDSAETRYVSVYKSHMICTICSTKGLEGASSCSHDVIMNGRRALYSMR